MGKLRIGWSEISITPDKKVALAGQFAERISEYVEKPITATAMAVTDGEEQMTLVSCDLVSIGWNLVQAVRKNLEGNTLGIDPMKIVLNAIHTHTGPVYKNIRRSASALARVSWKVILIPFGYSMITEWLSKIVFGEVKGLIRCSSGTFLAKVS